MSRPTVVFERPNSAMGSSGSGGVGRRELRSRRGENSGSVVSRSRERGTPNIRSESGEVTVRPVTDTEHTTDSAVGNRWSRELPSHRVDKCDSVAPSCDAAQYRSLNAHGVTNGGGNDIPPAPAEGSAPAGRSSQSRAWRRARGWSSPKARTSTVMAYRRSVVRFTHAVRPSGGPSAAESLASFTSEASPTGSVSITALQPARTSANARGTAASTRARVRVRSEERRVGKEGRARWWAYGGKRTQ